MQPQLVIKFVLRISFRKLHNIIVSPLEEGVLKEAIDAYKNIIISDSTLRNKLPPQLNNMTFLYKVRCDCECFISNNSVHSSLLTWYYRCPKHLKYMSQNVQTKRCSEISSHIFETYKNYVQPHGYHI